MGWYSFPGCSIAKVKGFNIYVIFQNGFFRRFRRLPSSVFDKKHLSLHVGPGYDRVTQPFPILKACQPCHTLFFLQKNQDVVSHTVMMTAFGYGKRWEMVLLQ